MELRQLRYLIAVAHHGSFTRAALELHVAQSALSEQVRRLERELGEQLLVRDRRGVHPTPAGETVLERGRRVMAEVDALTEEIASARGQTRGTLRLGILPPLAPLDVPALLEAFHDHCPEVELRLWEGTASETIQRLRDDQLDAAFMAMDVAQLPAPLAGLSAGRDELVVACPPDHPLATVNDVHLGLLADEPLVTSPPGSSLHAVATDALHAAGVAHRAAFESNHLGTIRALIARGLGVGLLPRTLTADPGPKVIARPVHGPAPAFPITLSWRAARHLPPAAAAFLNFAREVFPNENAGPRTSPAAYETTP